MEENGSSREGVRSAMAAASARLFFFDSLPEDPPQHFLDACFLCKTPIGGNRDIFMYRGDTPFCSEECRQEQIDIDEAREKTLAMSVKAAASSRKAAQGIEVSSAGAVLAV